MKKPPFDIVVLRHWREKSRDTNSGQLVTDCIAGARVVDMVDESYKNLAAHLPKGNVWLLFPESIDSSGNVVVPTHRGLPDPLPKTIVVVDGTWAEAQRMAKALPGLPRLVPQGGPRASERLLAPPQAGAMATAEAIAALIAEVDPYAAACLDRAYARHVTSLKKSNPYKAAIPIVSGIAYYPNPKKVPDVPIEATVRSERIGTKTRELTPGVHVVAQISRTGKEVWITHGEQRLFLYLQDDQGRGSLFYQSFAGTGGKAQGYWFPSGGILADQRGGGVWVIKGNPKTDPGAGREGLLALYEKANAVLPQSDAETDAFVKKATRVDYDDLMYKDEYEIKPTMKILEEGHANALQSKWNSWAYRFWALNALDKTWGKRTFNINENPLVGFERVPWKPSRSPRSEATFLSTAYPRLWEEALKNTELKIRVLVARDAAHMGDIGKKLRAIDADAKRAGAIVILILALTETGSYGLEGMIAEMKPEVGDSQRLSRPSPFMILHNLAEGLMNEPEVARRVMRQDGHSSVPRSSIDPAHVDTWAGRRGALEDSGNALADLFAKYVTTGKVAYNGSRLEISAIRQDLDVMVDYLKRNPGVYEILSGYRKLPASETDLKSLSMPAREAREIPIDLEGLFLNNPTDLVGRHIPDRYLAGLPAALQKQRIGELTESRDAYKRGDYSELPTDVTARKMGLVKQSNYTTTAKERGIEYRGDLRDMAKRVLMAYSGRAPANEVQQFAEALRASFAKGLAAWKSGGHRPGATAQNWATARVNSLVVGGKTSWTADKKLFEVLPAAVRAKIESMRQKQNPISVEVRLDGGYPAGYGEAVAGKHTRYLQSEAALTRIVEQGKEVVPRIKFVVDWDKNAAAKRPRIEKGERGVITLIASAATLQSRADDVEKGSQVRSGGLVSRDRKVSLYTAHTILHRLGDRIMPRPEDVMFMSLDSPGFVDRRAALVVTARVENAWRLLGEALAVAWNHTGGNDGLNRWLPTVVDTKACREGWVIDGQQAMAELVPYRLLYKKGREQGVKLMSDLPFVPRLEKAFTDYIDACIDQFTGQEVLI